MGYREQCNRDCSADVKALPNYCQADSSVRPKQTFESSFGDRLREAFGGAKNSEIAGRLGISDASVSAYMSGGSLPHLENLRKISELTKCSLHWLLTGEGEANLDPLRFLGQSERQIVEKMAADSGKDIEEMVRDLVNDGLIKRVTEMLANSRYLSASEIDQLHAIVALVATGEERDSKRETPRRLPSA